MNKILDKPQKINKEMLGLTFYIKKIVNRDFDTDVYIKIPALCEEGLEILGIKNEV
jgi:hypothetical protein